MEAELNRADREYGAHKIHGGKRMGLSACADEHGLIAALAIDHRANLRQAIAQARGRQGEATEEDLRTFKTLVTRVLTPHASAVLLDPEYGREALAARHPGTGLLLSYERSGYDSAGRERFPELIPACSVRRLVEAGAQGIKLLLYYNPFDDERVNQIKQAWVERVGAECLALDVPFFLEPLVYESSQSRDDALAFARRKPLYVKRTIEEFCRPRYGVDVLKIEWPIVPTFTAGLRAFDGERRAYSRAEAIEHLRATGAAATKPLVYLSGGYSSAVLCELLELAGEAGVRFAGVVCGRATWQEGIASYARGGAPALEDWLRQYGVAHLLAIKRTLARCATPWWQ
jgi:tagatose 1,6-diphosphate aldolase